MRNVYSDAAAAGTPGSPEFRSVQPQSIFQRVVKPALRATVSVVCAGSIAIQSVMVSSYAQMPPGTANLSNGQSDIQMGCPYLPTLGEDVPSVPPTAECPWVYVPGSPSPGASTSGASTSYVPQTGSPVPASLANAIQSAGEAANNVAQQLPNVWFPKPEDGDDVMRASLEVFFGLIIALGVFQWKKLSTTTVDAGMSDDLDAANLNSRRTVAWGWVATSLFFIGVFRHYFTYVAYAALKSKVGWNERAARWTSWASLYLVAAAATVYAAEAYGLVDEMMLKLKDDPAGHKRKLLTKDAPVPGAFGTARRQFMDALRDAKLVHADTVEIPAVLGNPRTRLKLPQKGTPEDYVEMHVYQWGYSQRLGHNAWIRKPDFVIRPQTLRTLPTKLVSDGAHVWQLIGRETDGYAIYRQPMPKDAKDAALNMNSWTKVGGQAIDLYPGPTTVWAINNAQDIYACPKPCDGAWAKVNGKGQAVAVGPTVNLATKSTYEQPVYVWVKDGNSKIWRRLESDTTGQYWRDATKDSNIAPRVRDLLNERDPLWDWMDPDKFKYPYLPFPPYERPFFQGTYVP